MGEGHNRNASMVDLGAGSHDSLQAGYDIGESQILHVPQFVEGGGVHSRQLTIESVDL